MAAKKFIDIGANLTDLMFKGIYNTNNKHAPDLNYVLDRAVQAGIKNIIITSGNIEDAKESLSIIDESSHKNILYTTIGCHPTRCSEIEACGDQAENYLEEMLKMINNNKSKVIAVGEFGLDYDRLHFTPKDVQLKWFEKQLRLVEATKLPMFLHCRNSASDLYEILNQNINRLHGGVVHSFDGTIEEANKFINLGYFIGLNGCSLRTENNLEVVKLLPVEKILLETDAPWCDIRSSFAGYKYIKTHYLCKNNKQWQKEHLVKGRNEPCKIVQVLEIVAALKQMNEDELASIVQKNTETLFKIF